MGNNEGNASMNMSLNLLVLRCKDIDLSRRFYEQLGLAFVEEKHGNGPLHYAFNNGEFVLELYPTAEGQSPDNVRVGFLTDDLVTLKGDLLKGPGVKVVKPPAATADRIVMVLEDPDGRKVEISQMLHR
jgi:lactoylglutathione lyase